MRSLLILFLLSLTSMGQFLSLSKQATSKSELLSEVKSVQPGQTFSVAFVLSHPLGWHSYYLNPGGIELPPQISWQLPPGFVAGTMQWPVPEVTEPSFQMDAAAPEVSYTYSHDKAFFLVDVTVPNDESLLGQSVTIVADAQWQICQKSCKNEKAQRSITLPVVAKSEVDPATQPRFAGVRAAQAPVASFDFEAIQDGETIQLRVEGAPLLRDVHFIADQNLITPLATMKVRQDGDIQVVDLKTRAELFSGAETSKTGELSGFLRYRDEQGERVVRVPNTPITRAAAPALPLSRFFPVIFGMFLGGLILNLMPCVFPVIGIKILGFVQQAGQDQRKIMAHGLIFAAGVLVSFAILSGILFVARQATTGADLGWGYQLQNPYVVLGLMMLMFLMALNLFGVFEIGTSITGIGGKWQSQQGLLGTFFSGVLATVVATPCSGPFLGAAIGAAIVLPAFQFFLAFGCMAIGLAAPYLVLSIFPDMVKWLPRPGAWMETMKQGMSFLLFATTGYLLWVYAGLIDLDHLLQPIFGLTGVAMAAWIYGRWCTLVQSVRTRWTAAAVSFLLAAASITYAAMIKKGLEWETWSPQRVEQLLEQNRPVYVDFTAKWCLTCQVNKSQAYSEEVIALMKERGIVALKADKTKPNPEIEEKLAELGRTAIPVNVLYVPGREPIITPEVLTSSYLLDLFREKTTAPAK
jgi:thiol:disulfide interchange protein DsbD